MNTTEIKARLYEIKLEIDNCATKARKADKLGQKPKTFAKK